MVEGTGLEHRQACKRLVGSNPTLSASFRHFHCFLKLINPISQLDNTSKPKKSKPRDRRLEDGEYEILVEEAHRSVEKRQGGPDSTPWLPYLIRFLTHSGLRLGETSRIESDENQIAKRLVYLHKTKNDKDRIVPLPKGAYDALMDFKDHWGEETVFDLSAKT